MKRPSTAVVHLVRRSNGVEAFRRFLDEYAGCRGGKEHSLVVLFKGFGAAGPSNDYLDLLGGVPHERLGLYDYGYDLRGYFAAVRRTSHDVYCFLNSFSRLKDPEWLAKLQDAWERDRAGIVGATGSWQSHRDVLDGTPAEGRCIPFFGARIPLPGAAGDILRRFVVGRHARRYAAFPNPHLRTNAFLAGREVLIRIRTGLLIRKSDAHYLESGRTGLTAQVDAMGLPVLVVGRDGKAYPRETWPESRTYFSGEQENLLVGDNRTEEYRRARPEEKRRLARQAWGDVSRRTTEEAP